jgi:hypothetical protein
MNRTLTVLIVALALMAVACGSNTTPNASGTALATGTAGPTASTAAPPTSQLTPRPLASVAAAGPDASTGTMVDWGITACGTYSGEGCAPTSQRVDMQRPTFSNPTAITNPLFPISSLKSVVLLGQVDGLPFRSETTLIPGDHTVTVDGVPIPVAISQYTAYLDGRIDEVAIDRYAQADDGSVWYLGEDVFDYRNGTAAMTEGTWLAGRDGPPAMIMPASPQVGDAFRSENVIGVVFEELTVKQIGQTVDGPTGPVDGAVIMQELHLDGSVSDKFFAPGYGEFNSIEGPDVEALAFAVPTNAIDEPVPTDLRLITTSAFGILENARLEDWEAANPTLARVQALWLGLESKGFPTLVVDTVDRGLAALESAVRGEDVAATSQAAVDVAQSALDLELLYRNVEVDRFHLHAQQLRIHAAADDPGGVTGEVAVLEWIRDRIEGSLSESKMAELDSQLRELRGAASAGNLKAAADIAARAAAALRRD